MEHQLADNSPSDNNLTETPSDIQTTESTTSELSEQHLEDKNTSFDISVDTPDIQIQPNTHLQDTPSNNNFPPISVTTSSVHVTNPVAISSAPPVTTPAATPGPVSAPQPPIQSNFSSMSSCIKLAKFTGDGTVNPSNWWSEFENWVKFHDLSIDKQLHAFPFQLESHAKIWFETLSSEVKSNISTFKENFLKRFKGDDIVLDLSILQIHQGSTESVLEYLSRLFKLASVKNVSNDLLLAIAVQGLQPDIKKWLCKKNQKH